MKILIVEDQIKILKALKRGFEAEKLQADIAPDGEEGLLLASSGNYDAIVLDLMLPKLDGLSLLKKIRAQGVNTPVIILTAKEAIADKLTGFEIGADDYLTKPFAFSELLARVKAIIKRQKAYKRVLKIDGLELDLEKHLVTRNGKDVKLSAKEYQLLEYLVRNAGGILNESQIIDHVWSYDYQGSSNVVAVYIRYLRNKVDRAFPTEKPLLKTVKGLGYKIEIN